MRNRILTPPPQIACPPDTLITCPVSILACSLERNNIVSAMSSGCISLPIGINGSTAFSKSASIHPVCVVTGANSLRIIGASDDSDFIL